MALGSAVPGADVVNRFDFAGQLVEHRISRWVELSSIASSRYKAQGLTARPEEETSHAG